MVRYIGEDEGRVNRIEPALESLEELKSSDGEIESSEEDSFGDVSGVNEESELHVEESEVYSVAWMAQKFCSPPLTCISKVPLVLRKGNKETYTPQLVSIGPYHHGIQRLKGMEELKIRYQSDLLHRRTELTRDIFAQNLNKLEEFARGCYEDPIRYKSGEFVDMMLLDGCFIIELLLKYWEHKTVAVATRDVLFRSHSMLPALRIDMLLLENQLPYFVLELIFDLFRVPEPHLEERSLVQLVLHFFSFKSYLSIAQNTPRGRANNAQWSHFLDLLRDCCLLSREDSLLEKKLDMVRDDKTIPSASELYDAGVKFTRVTGNIFSLKFHPNGVFEIPLLTIHDYTNVLFGNLLAFEQCFEVASEQYITLYLHLMDSLINSPNDVATLRRCGIIDNVSADDEHVSRLINNISKGTVINTDIDFYQAVSKDVMKYYNKPWNLFKAMLFREYLYSPWSIASSAAVIIVVICTIIQTVCSVISVL